MSSEAGCNGTTSIAKTDANNYSETARTPIKPSINIISAVQEQYPSMDCE